jgi:mRNA interferase RelE/StbE
MKFTADKVAFNQKDLQKINSKDINIEILNLIEILENTKSIRLLVNVKKMKGFSKYYRIRIGDYRIGCLVDQNTFELMRFAHRKDIYSIFP